MPLCPKCRAAFTSGMKAAAGTYLHPLGKGLACIFWMPTQPGPEPVLTTMSRWPNRPPKLLPFGGHPDYTAGVRLTSSTARVLSQVDRATIVRTAAQNPSNAVMHSITNRCGRFDSVMDGFANFKCPAVTQPSILGLSTHGLARGASGGRWNWKARGIRHAGQTSPRKTG